VTAIENLTRLARRKVLNVMGIVIRVKTWEKGRNGARKEGRGGSNHRHDGTEIRMKGAGAAISLARILIDRDSWLCRTESIDGAAEQCQPEGGTKRLETHP
jgi:hypothetical protein